MFKRSRIPAIFPVYPTPDIGISSCAEAKQKKTQPRFRAVRHHV